MTASALSFAESFYTDKHTLRKELNRGEELSQPSVCQNIGLVRSTTHHNASVAAVTTTHASRTTASLAQNHMDTRHYTTNCYSLWHLPWGWWWTTRRLKPRPWSHCSRLLSGNRPNKYVFRPLLEAQRTPLAPPGPHYCTFPLPSSLPSPAPPFVGRATEKL